MTEATLVRRGSGLPIDGSRTRPFDRDDNRSVVLGRLANPRIDLPEAGTDCQAYPYSTTSRVRSCNIPTSGARIPRRSHPYPCSRIRFFWTVDNRPNTRDSLTWPIFAQFSYSCITRVHVCESRKHTYPRTLWRKRRLNCRRGNLFDRT